MEGGEQHKEVVVSFVSTFALSFMEMLVLVTREISFKHELPGEVLMLRAVVICVHLISSVLVVSCVRC